MSNTVVPSGPRRGAEVLESVLRLSAGLRQGTAAPLLDLGGIDALDILISPIFMDSLNAVRTSRVRRPHSLLTRAKVWISQTKQRLAESQLAALAAPIGPTDILMWPREITHVSVFCSVAAALAERGVKSSLVTSYPKCFREARAAGLQPSLSAVGWPDVIREAKREGRRRSRELSDIATDPRSIEPSDKLIAASLHRTLLANLQHAAAAVADARAALERFRPRLLVVGNDLTLEGRAACRVAAQLGIPTAVFMHGNITASVLHAEHCADRIIVFGEAHRQILLRLGIGPTRIVICGAPQLDEKIPPSRAIHPQLQSGLSLRDGQPWILVATSGPGQSISHTHHRRVLENLAAVARAFPNVPLVCKLHRKDQLAHYRDFLKACAGLPVFVIPRSNKAFPYDIFEWLKGCSLVLTGASTVAVEAMLMNVPVVTMDFCEELRNIDFIDAGATIHTKNETELQQAIATVLQSGLPEDVRARAKQYVEHAFYSLDGRSGQRGAAALMELAEASHGSINVT